MLREGKGKLVKVIRHNHQEKQNRRYIQQLYLPFQLVILPKYFCTVVPNITQSERFRQLFD